VRVELGPQQSLGASAGVLTPSPERVICVDGP
jgi:hypothetical protein